MRISVTSEDIRDGVPTSATHCPIALAINRIFPGSNARVTNERVYLHNWYGPNKVLDLPEKAIDFIKIFDNGDGEFPFEFEV